MRELSVREVEEVSGGLAPLLPIGFSAGTGALWGGLSYSFDSTISGSFSWAGFTGSVLQGAATGALVGLGAFMMTVPGGAVAAASAEGLAGIIQVVDPSASLQ